MPLPVPSLTASMPEPCPPPIRDTTMADPSLSSVRNASMADPAEDPLRPARMVAASSSMLELCASTAGRFPNPPTPVRSATRATPPPVLTAWTAGPSTVLEKLPPVAWSARTSAGRPRTTAAAPAAPPRAASRKPRLDAGASGDPWSRTIDRCFRWTCGCAFIALPPSLLGPAPEVLGQSAHDPAESRTSPAIVPLTGSRAAGRAATRRHLSKASAERPAQGRLVPRIVMRGIRTNPQ